MILACRVEFLVHPSFAWKDITTLWEAFVGLWDLWFSSDWRFLGLRKLGSLMLKHIIHPDFDNWSEELFLAWLWAVVSVLVFLFLKAGFPIPVIFPLHYPFIILPLFFLWRLLDFVWFHFTSIWTRTSWQSLLISLNVFVIMLQNWIAVAARGFWNETSCLSDYIVLPRFKIWILFTHALWNSSLPMK